MYVAGAQRSNQGLMAKCRLAVAAATQTASGCSIHLAFCCPSLIGFLKTKHIDTCHKLKQIPNPSRTPCGTVVDVCGLLGPMANLTTAVLKVGLAEVSVS